MANNWTVSQSGANGGSSITHLSNLMVAAYDRNFRMALRSTPMFRAIADVKPANQTNPGDAITFSFYSDLAKVSTPLDEVIDPDSVGMPNPTRVTVTLAEYGNAVIDTNRLQKFSLDPGLAAKIGNTVAYNMAESVDGIVETELAGGAQVIRESAGSLSTSAAITTIAGSDTFKSRDVRFAVTKLRAAQVLPTRGEDYACYIHPEVSHDLRVETGAGGWRTPKEYVDTGNLYAAEIGKYEGAIYIETPRCLNSQRGSGAGAAQVRVYNTYVVGQEALAEAVAQEFAITSNAVIPDLFNRKNPIGWYGIAGWKRFRPESLWRIETASSVRPTT